MDNKKDNAYYVNKIATDLDFIIRHTENVSIEVLKSDEVLLDSVMFRLIQISENSLKLTEDFKKRYSEVPWKAIKGLRNKIVHEYGDVDLTVIYDTVKSDVPSLHKLLISL